MRGGEGKGREWKGKADRVLHIYVRANEKTTTTVRGLCQIVAHRSALLCHRLGASFYNLGEKMHLSYKVSIFMYVCMP